MIKKAFIMSELICPKMVIFDYGHTLVYEENWNGEKAAAAILEHASANKDNLSAGQVAAFNDTLYFETMRMGRKFGLEAHEHQFHNLIYEYLQIKIDLTPLQIEELQWDNAAPAHAMPHIKETLAYLRRRGIRTAVISNISFSGGALKNRINSVLPDNNFEFIIASSEYVVRKPNKLIFELALRKAGLDARDVWFCGDSVDYDIIGAKSAGIYPVWYESDIDCWYVERGDQIKPDFEHLHITDWRELIDALSQL